MDHKSYTAIISILALSLSIPFGVLSCAGRLNDPFYIITQAGLSSLSLALLIAIIIRYGQKKLWLSIFPVSLGVLSFIFKLFIDPRGKSILHHTAAILLYIAIITLWLLTVLYIIKSKWVLVILFTLATLKHIILDDIPVLLGKAAPISTAMWLKECSILLTMVGLAFCAASFKKS